MPPADSFFNELYNLDTSSPSKQIEWAERAQRELHDHGNRHGHTQNQIQNHHNNRNNHHHIQSDAILQNLKSRTATPIPVPISVSAPVSVPNTSNTRRHPFLDIDHLLSSIISLTQHIHQQENQIDVQWQCIEEQRKQLLQRDHVIEQQELCMKRQRQTVKQLDRQVEYLQDFVGRCRDELSSMLVANGGLPS